MNKLSDKMRWMLLAAALAFPVGAAQADGNLKCTMQFAMKGWSAFYKTASGHGTVHCGDGSAMEVALSSKGGGLTLGKSSIDNGYGEFTGVYNIHDVLGAYATGSAHGAAVQSAAVSALTKGEVSLALKGTGHGWDAGIDFGKFVISEVATPVPPPSPTTEAVPEAPPPGQ